MSMAQQQDQTRDTWEAAVSVLMDGQEGCWPLTTRARIASASTWVTTPEEVFPLLGQMDYIGPWGFSDKKRDKANAAKLGNLLWLDLDPPPDMTAGDRSGWLAEQRERLLGLLPLPTVIVSSGRGEWLYWKLSGRIAKEEFERVNRLLPRIAGSSDTGSWSAEHWARLPGSTNEKTGETAVVRAISQERYDADQLLSVIESVANSLGIDTRPRSGARSAEAESGVCIAISPNAPQVRLSAKLNEYVRSNPDWNQAHRVMGIDRSASDQSIVAQAVNQGFSDSEIKAWFEARRLCRYLDERRQGHGDRYLARSIYKARNGWARPPSPNPRCVYTESDPKYQDADGKSPKHVDPKDVLNIVRLHHGALFKLLQELVAEALGCSLVTAKRRLKQLERDRYIILDPVPGRGGPKRVLLAQRGLDVFTPAATPYERMCKTVRSRPNHPAGSPSHRRVERESPTRRESADWCGNSSATRSARICASLSTARSRGRSFNYSHRSTRSKAPACRCTSRSRSATGRSSATSNSPPSEPSSTPPGKRSTTKRWGTTHSVTDSPTSTLGIASSESQPCSNQTTKDSA